MGDLKAVDITVCARLIGHNSPPRPLPSPSPPMQSKTAVQDRSPRPLPECCHSATASTIVYGSDTLEVMCAAYDTAVQLFPQICKIMKERAGDWRSERVTVKALPGPALEVIEAKFFFQLLVCLLADPSRLDRGCQSAKVSLRG